MAVRRREQSRLEPWLSLLKNESGVPDIGFDDFGCAERRWIRQATQDSKAAELTLNRARARTQASASKRTMYPIFTNGIFLSSIQAWIVRSLTSYRRAMAGFLTGF